jgi:hypothetical protein
MKQLLSKEPALITGLVNAIIVLAVSFGLSLTGEQIAAIAGVMAVVQAIITRAKVTPTITRAKVTPTSQLPSPKVPEVGP